jgi:hypothetical protein
MSFIEQGLSFRHSSSAFPCIQQLLKGIHLLRRNGDRGPPFCAPWSANAIGVFQRQRFAKITLVLQPPEDAIFEVLRGGTSGAKRVSTTPPRKAVTTYN